MKNLFLIDGASGTGKSDLVQYVQDFTNDVGLVPKYSTRSERDYESHPDWQLDLTIVLESEFDDLGLDYTYTYGGKRYGFYLDHLTEALRRYSNVLVIVRSAGVIRALQDRFQFINVVPVYVYTDLDEVKNRLRRQHFTEEQIAFRLSRHKMAFEDYLKNPDLYRDVLINNSSIEDYHRLIDLTLRKYAGAPDIDETLVFLLMSFRHELPLLDDIAPAIKRAVRQHDPKLRCINLDDVHKGAYEISPEAKNQIRRSRLAIVDLTENRPNVYYELGFVHGISKDCILTCHAETTPHFYPAGHRIVFYRNATELENMMSAELAGVLDRER